MNNLMKAMGIAAAVLLANPATAAFRCVDETGRTHIGDTPPELCAKVVMYEVTRSGQVLRTIQPSLTDEQIKARIADEDRKKESDKASFEQKRKDLALLATYSTEEEFDVVLNRNIEPITGRITNAQERMVAIDKRNKELDEELEFYKAGKTTKASAKKVEAPPNMVEEQGRLKHEKVVLTKNITGYEKEIVELKAKFGVDKKRWLALKSGNADKPADAKAADAKPTDAKPTEAKAEPKPGAKPVKKN
jgi:hypothetical protein